MQLIQSNSRPLFCWTLNGQTSFNLSNEPIKGVKNLIDNLAWRLRLLNLNQTGRLQLSLVAWLWNIDIWCIPWNSELRYCYIYVFILHSEVYKELQVAWFVTKTKFVTMWTYVLPNSAVLQHSFETHADLKTVLDNITLECFSQML